ncbi:MAG: ArsR family transcriptional regulator [Chloroflexi bacterium RBG_16_70_13]|nr:MAG: ArsR family transcriptional regulator [Chloroflexi bacterium RBG_16_70_13]
MTTPRTTKTALNEQFARIGKALASPRRIELLDLLAQGEHSVEVLASETDMSVTLTSSHLQALRQARLVETRREGQRIFYRLAGDDVLTLLTALRAVAHDRLAEVDRVVRAYFGAPEELEPIGRDELVRRARTGDVVLLDLRPRKEYEAGHIPGAVSIPLEDLEAQLALLPPETEIVAYCRGPYCVLAPRGIALLRRHGYRVRRLEDGVGEWRLAGLPVVTGVEPGATPTPPAIGTGPS